MIHQAKPTTTTSTPKRAGDIVYVLLHSVPETYDIRAFKVGKISNSCYDRLSSCPPAASTFYPDTHGV
jgi:hypothetical protein